MMDSKEYRGIDPVTDIKSMLNTSTRLFGSRDAFKNKEEDKKSYCPITFQTLSSDVNALGTILVLNGLKGKNIAILGENSYEWVVAYLSVICGTGVAVPLDKDWNLHELKLYTNATDCDCIIFSENFEDVVWELYNDGVTPIQTCICMGSKKSGSQFMAMEEAISEGEKYMTLGNRDFLDAQITRDDLAVIQFTTEISGDPRPVMVTHGNIAALLTSLTDIVSIDENDVFFSHLPMSNPLKSIAGLLLPLYKGASMVFPEDDKNIEDILREFEPSILLGSQRELKIFNLHNCRDAQGRDSKYSSPSIILYGDDGAKVEMIHSLRNMGIFVAQAFVLPQCSSIVTLNLSCDYVEGSVGRTIPGVEVRVANADSQTGIGEICFKGPTVAIGYYNKLDCDTLIYVSDFKEGWYCTGHMGRIDENNYIYMLK